VVLLFVLTCLTAFLAGATDRNGDALQAWLNGLMYAGAVMTILLTHELGHYLQARRYRVDASYPFFLPFLPPIGTLGALIVMRQRIPDRKALYDIGISGPLAGLVPALFFSVVGIRRAVVEPIILDQGGIYLGEPLLMQWLTQAFHGPIPEGHALWIGPLGMAGWVGLFVTALNLMPIGQLDGGHVLYALIRRRAHTVATGLLVAAIATVIALGMWHWVLMLTLLTWVGPRHPPTGNDYVALGRGRIILGWLTLAFVIIGFTPVPLSFEP
jgi:membrane-associated protease RseP (regulator of RpoE activity)